MLDNMEEEAYTELVPFKGKKKSDITHGAPAAQILMIGLCCHSSFYHN
jgi:hypothetical protein